MIKLIKRAYNNIRHKLRDVGIKSKRSPKWHDVQKHFLEKNPICEICSSNKKLNVHHKKPFHIYPEFELDEDNLITLCMGELECHLIIGHGDYFKAYNPSIDEDVKIIKNNFTMFDDVAINAKLNRKVN